MGGVALVYLLMALAGLAAAVYVVRRDRRPAELAATFVLAAAGVMLADWIAYGWFDLYRYRSHLVGDPQVDCALGELLADILFVPSLAVVLAARLPDLNGAVIFTFAVTAIEYLFVRYDLLIHTGWKSWYSALLFLWYFLWVARVRQRMAAVGLADRALRLWVRGAILFAAVGIYTLVLRPFGLTITNIHLMPTRQGNQSLGRFLTYPTVFVPLGFWVLAGERRQRWWRLGAAAATFTAMNAIMVAVHFQRFRPPYTWYLDALGQAAMLGLACAGDDLLSHYATRSQNRAI
jgi:hypothetical protein